MTQWTGHSTVRTALTGPHGGHLRVGKFLVPKHIFVDYAGSDGHPDLHLHLEWRDGRPQVVALTVTSKPDGRGVRTSDLERLALDGIARSVFVGESVLVVEDRADGVMVAEPPDWSDPRFDLDFWQLDKQVSDAITATRGPKSPAQLANVAEIYSRHEGRNALLAIAAALGVSERTAARRVNDARAAGLLPPATKNTSKRKA